jgi:hypothetical protein
LVEREGELWVSSPQEQYVYNLFVNNLLLQGEKRQDVHKLSSLFPATVTEIIMAVPLLEDVKED